MKTNIESIEAHIRQDKFDLPVTSKYFIIGKNFAVRLVYFCHNLTENASNILTLTSMALFISDAGI